MNNIRLIDYFAAHAMVAIGNNTSYGSWIEVACQAYDLAYEMMRESKLRDSEGRELSYHEANR